jgi:hypothetical protein
MSSLIDDIYVTGNGGSQMDLMLLQQIIHLLIGLIMAHKIGQPLPQLQMQVGHNTEALEY